MTLRRPTREFDDWEEEGTKLFQRETGLDWHQKCDYEVGIG
jgi:hypothetical protein